MRTPLPRAALAAAASLLLPLAVATTTLATTSASSATVPAPTERGVVRTDRADALGDVKGQATRSVARDAVDLLRLTTFHDDDAAPTRVYVQLELEGRPDDAVRRTFRLRVLDQSGAPAAVVEAVTQRGTRSVTIAPVVDGVRGAPEECAGLRADAVQQRTMPTFLVDLPAACLRRYAEAGSVAVTVVGVDFASRRAEARDAVPAGGTSYDLS